MKNSKKLNKAIGKARFKQSLKYFLEEVKKDTNLLFFKYYSGSPNDPSVLNILQAKQLFKKLEQE